MRKLMWFAMGFAIAIMVGMYSLWGERYFLAAGIAAVLLAVFIYLSGRFPKLRIGVALFLGCMIGFVWISVFDAVYLSVPRAADEERLNMTITATDYSRETDYGTSVEGIGKINGKIYRIQVYLPEEVSLSPGDTLTGRFALRSSLPGCSNASNYYRTEHIFLTAKISKMPLIQQAEKMPWYGYAAYVRQQVKYALDKALPSDVSGFSIALLIGDKTQIDYETNASFKASGISHIIAVSGLHVTILFSLVYMLLGRKRILAMVVGVPVLFFFAAVAGFSPSIMRACLMHMLMVTAMLFDRDYDPPTALGFAVLVMLVLDPWTVTSVSFQLSVGCMAGIILFTEPIRQYLMDKQRLGRLRGKWKKLANGFASSVGMSIGAMIFVTPLCAYYFGTVSLMGTITNLLTLWMVTFVFYGAMGTCVAGLIWLPFGKVLGWIVAWPIRYILMVAKTLASFPLAAVYMDSLYMVIWLVFVYLLLIVHFVIEKKQIVTMFCCAVISLCIALTATWIEPLQDECRVTVLDVGQGQCILLQSQGKTFVVDCGGDQDTDAADTAANALRSQGIFQIDGLILTHYDRDHAAGAQYLLSQVPAETILLPNCADGDGTGATISEEFSKRIITEVTTIGFGQAKITLIPSKNDLSNNESGLCVLFQTKNCDILITGDRSTEGELELMRMIDLPKLEVLIVGHHGSKYSTGDALLEATEPEIAIISVGKDNSYGHPTQEVLDRLENIGCEIYRTDLHGKVVYRG